MHIFLNLQINQVKTISNQQLQRTVDCVNILLHEGLKESHTILLNFRNPLHFERWNEKLLRQIISTNH